MAGALSFSFVPLAPRAVSAHSGRSEGDVTECLVRRTRGHAGVKHMLPRPHLRALTQLLGLEPPLPSQHRARTGLATTGAPSHVLPAAHCYLFIPGL